MASSSCICGKGGKLLFYLSDHNVEDEHTMTDEKCDPMLKNGGDTFRIAVCQYADDDDKTLASCFSSDKSKPLCDPLQTAIRKLNVGFPNNEAQNRIVVPLAKKEATCNSLKGANLAMLYAWGTPDHQDNRLQTMVTRLAGHTTDGKNQLIHDLEQRYPPNTTTPPSCGIVQCVNDFTLNVFPDVLEDRLKGALKAKSCGDESK